MASLTRGAPLLVLVLAAGCMREGSPATEQPRPAAVRAGRPAPEIEGVDAQGRTFRLSDYRGKVVLLHFWRES
jgi:cytochrome oxidase Cu insertion factor (SCO1/SenC/PrrC family)